MDETARRHRADHIARNVDAASLLVGVWLAISPAGFLLDVPDTDNASTAIVATGIVVIALSAAAMLHMANRVLLSVCLMVLGAWTVALPWAFSFSGDASSASFVNAIVCGSLIWLLGLGSMVAAAYAGDDSALYPPSR